jgi:phosphoribosylformylglycinamidine (FGAM) synthase-like enzyme
VLSSYLLPSSDRVTATPEEYEFDSLDENVVDQALTPLFDNAPKESITNGNKRGKKDKSSQKGKRAMKNMFNKRGHETTNASSSTTTSLYDRRQNRTNNNPNMILRGVHTRFGSSANTLSDDSSSVVPLSRWCYQN